MMDGDIAGDIFIYIYDTSYLLLTFSVIFFHRYENESPLML